MVRGLRVLKSERRRPELGMKVKSAGECLGVESSFGREQFWLPASGFPESWPIAFRRVGGRGNVESGIRSHQVGGNSLPPTEASKPETIRQGMPAQVARGSPFMYFVPAPFPMLEFHKPTRPPDSPIHKENDLVL